MRQSPGLKVGWKKPDPYPTRAFPFKADDEAYQFRQPNTAYMKQNTQEFELPEGLVSDGSQPRHFGDAPVSHEDNDKELRHNSAKKGHRK